MKMIIDWITEIDLVTEKFKRSFNDFTEEEMNDNPKKILGVSVKILLFYH